ncbi:hypothetical protein D5278_21330, partial [bacterium 1XD21-13]|nr:hypothetical protein [bacterium 1XD21-13]
ESFCSGTAGSARSRLEEFYESLEDIYKKHVIEFENADDDYKREAARVYDACTSARERFWDIGAKIGKLVNDINDGIDAAIYDFVSGIFGLAFTLAKIDVAIRVAVMTAPFGITPQWVKDTGKETIEGVQSIAQILRNPGRALASLGQQVTDTVEEKGITYALSYVTADIAIGILVDKGIGKIRGLDKADDVVNISTKVDDVVDVADDLGDTMKVVDKIDDVADITKAADKVDDAVSVGELKGVSKTGTVWDNISGTADNMPSTEIPATFKIDLDDSINYINPETGTNTLWTNANATEHMGEYIGRFGEESWSIGVRSQVMLESYSSSLNQAMSNLSLQTPGRYFGVFGNWELGINTQTGVVYHAKML